MTEPITDVAPVGVVIVTHADYGSALLRAAEVILGSQDDCGTVSVDGTSEVAETVARLKETVARVDKGRGVLILTDMFGGTPTNLSLSLLSAGNVEVVTGVNLPMLLKVFGCRKMDLHTLADEAKASGDKGIVVAGAVLRRKVKNG
ncbi:PTS sugar transporter subunit IIA [Desulfovibrio subterraneus]|jgi:PTS system mannose-specific IIA component|uniref:PTS sugar transporter subunit IIA n=1 Tax=Desulfovibrio subterraneus TaxID=2718620 RepID=A0A7J0BKW4_9BACT|nr:PTS sugar transporter subunit IIA [Desulfovibrio subterraneus]WBF67983.1 PTS sugar transporter subunit IIA [Desulfovibrio subterraneus]GFM33852.1 PTS sugar transporter subunit IIA [Desulfovibrio subterraneus]